MTRMLLIIGGGILGMMPACAAANPGGFSDIIVIDTKRRIASLWRRAFPLRLQRQYQVAHSKDRRGLGGHGWVGR